MSIPTFIDYSPETPITASWLNAVSQVIFGLLANGQNIPPTTVAQLLANLGLSGLSNPLYATNYGVVADGVTDDSVALQAAMTAAFTAGKLLILPPGTIRTTQALSYTATGSAPIAMVGQGRGVTTIRNDNFNQILTINGNSGTLQTSVSFSGFSIGRTNANSYTGAIGPKSLYISYALNSFVDNIEEFGGIGFGIQFDMSTNVSVRNCVVHDSIGNGAGRSGTDGIHFYRCTRAHASGNTVYRRGDDCISFGSYSNTNPAQQIIAQDNYCYGSGGSGVKLYGIVNEALVTGNNIDSTGAGGVQISDDFYNFTGAFGPSLTRIKISDNLISNITGGSFNIGGVYLNSWSGGAGGLLSNWNDIEVTANQIFNCNGGITQRGTNPSQNQVNIDITDNKIDGNGNINTGPGILLTTWYGNVNISRNRIYNIDSIGIQCDSSSTPYLATGWTNARVNISDNIVDTYNTILGNNNRGIWFRTSDISTILTVKNNSVTNQQLSDAVTSPGNAILLAACSPLSVIASNTTDFTGTLSYANTNGYQGEPSSGVVPTGFGTWYAGQRIVNSNLGSAAVPPFWTCATSGTAGTLNGGATTGSINTGSRTLSVNSSVGLFVGAVVAIAGVTGVFIVEGINGTNVTLSTTAGATVAGAAVSFAAATFRTAANWAS